MRPDIAIVLLLAALGCQPEEEGKMVQGPDAVGFDDNGRTLESNDFSVIEEFIYKVSPVDVLFVVDDSCSMSEEQTALNVGFPGFFNLLEVVGDQYHIGVVSTDMDDPAKSGRLRTYEETTKFITADTPNAFEAFDDMLTGLGIKGSAFERGVFATNAALDFHRDGYNDGFYREEAALMVVALSDEPDQSRDDIAYPDFLEWFLDLKPKAEPGWLTFNSIIGPPGGCSSPSGDATEGEGYIELTGNTGGVLHSICDTGFGPALERMIGQIPTEMYTLSEEPAIETLVIVAEQPDGSVSYLQEGDWIYYPEEMAFQLRTAIADESTLRVRYLPLSLLVQ
jgi:hypothetical protein